MGTKRGPKPRPESELRTIRVSPRFSESEYETVTANAGTDVPKRVAAYLRDLALGRTPNQIPQINREAWAELSRSAANLNQLQRSINQGDLPELEAIKKELAIFRSALIGVDLRGDDDEG